MGDILGGLSLGVWGLKVVGFRGLRVPGQCVFVVLGFRGLGFLGLYGCLGSVGFGLGGVGGGGVGVFLDLRFGLYRCWVS